MKVLSSLTVVALAAAGLAETLCPSQLSGEFSVGLGREVILNTACAGQDGVFKVSSFTVLKGGYVGAVGGNALQMLSGGDVRIDGVFNVSGTRGGNANNDQPSAGGGAGGGAVLFASRTTITIDGELLSNGGYGGDAGAPGQAYFSDGQGGNGVGGRGVAGGYNGGDGTPNSHNGKPGHGPGASGAGATHGGVPPGAAGAGYATRGSNGHASYSGNVMQGGPAYGDESLSTGLLGGSGAGSGGNDGDNEEGAGGGGSGGTIWLSAPHVSVGGLVSAQGGLGGLDDYHHHPGNNRNGANNGGAGSAGRIRLDQEGEYEYGHNTARVPTTPTAFRGHFAIDERCPEDPNAVPPVDYSALITTLEAKHGAELAVLGAQITAINAFKVAQAAENTAQAAENTALRALITDLSSKLSALATKHGDHMADSDSADAAFTAADATLTKAISAVTAQVKGDQAAALAVQGAQITAQAAALAAQAAQTTALAQKLEILTITKDPATGKCGVTCGSGNLELRSSTPTLQQ